MHVRFPTGRRAILAGAAALLLVVVGTGPVAADQSNHTERLQIAVTADGLGAGYPSLRTGQIVNIHASGPMVFALERYQLNGAAPDTAYNVVLLFNAGSCSGDFAFPFANGVTLVTDAQGDAHGKILITPQDVADFGLHDTDWGITWTFVDGQGVTAYSTPCTNVHID